MDQAWIDASRTYSALDESGRLDYWSRLTEDQRTALTQALAESSVTPIAPETSIAPATPIAAPLNSGCGKTGAIGCGGIVLGALLTIAIEVIAVYRGVDALSRQFKEPTRPASTRPVYELGHCSDKPARRTDRNFDAFCRANGRSN